MAKQCPAQPPMMAGLADLMLYRLILDNESWAVRT
jgi:hypothetical protein